MQRLIVVNASHVLADAEVQAMTAPLQTQIDRDFLPAWGGKATAVDVSFAPASEIPNLPPDSWPIFLNQHSNDPGALGWHDDQSNRIFSRVFVGDCKLFSLDWRVTLSHEALEMILDPDIKRAWSMPDGRLAAFEACDAVEADELGYSIGGQICSNFVLPAYFSESKIGPFDFRHVLQSGCPSLAPGGYMSVTDASGAWTEIQARHANGLPGRRSLLKGHRRAIRAARTGQPNIELVVLN